MEFQGGYDCTALMDIIRSQYEIDAQRIDLFRDLIGRVYLVNDRFRAYVFKLYRPHHTCCALKSTEVLNYLTERGYPVVSIVPTKTGDLSIMADTPQGPCVGVLYNHVQGEEPVLDTEIAVIASQVGRLHELMRDFPYVLPYRGKDFYIDRYISILERVGYPRARIDELDDLGTKLWRRMERLPRGFCHGDLHTGNMIRQAPGVYVLMDFDAASCSHPIIDVATLCDCTDFNHLDPASYGRTVTRTKEFCQGYGRVSTLGSDELAAIVDFIAIRHYEIVATIVSCQGLQEVSPGFWDQQYGWLMEWYELCERERQSH